MALKASNKRRGDAEQNRPPIIRSPALENLEQLAMPPARRGRAASAVADTKPRANKASNPGPLGNAQENPNKIPGAPPDQPERRIEPLPAPTERSDYKLLAAVGGYSALAWSWSTAPAPQQSMVIPPTGFGANCSGRDSDSSPCSSQPTSPMIAGGTSLSLSWVERWRY